VRLGAHPVLLIARLAEETDNLKSMAGRVESPVKSYEKAAHRITCIAGLAGCDTGQLGTEIVVVAHLHSGRWLAGIGVYFGDSGSAGKGAGEALEAAAHQRVGWLRDPFSSRARKRGRESL